MQKGYFYSGHRMMAHSKHSKAYIILSKSKRRFQTSAPPIKLPSCCSEWIAAHLFITMVIGTYLYWLLRFWPSSHVPPSDMTGFMGVSSKQAVEYVDVSSFVINYIINLWIHWTSTFCSFFRGGPAVAGVERSTGGQCLGELFMPEDSIVSLLGMKRTIRDKKTSGGSNLVLTVPLELGPFTLGVYIFSVRRTPQVTDADWNCQLGIGQSK